MLQEFKDFALKGNVIDLAVGIIIGVAFGAIVSSLVDDIIMPIIGVVLSGVDFSDIFITLNEGTPAGPYATLAQAKAAGAATWNVGLFVNAVFKFVIIAFALFLIVRVINRLKRAPVAVPPPAAPTKEEVLLGEIRDLLASRAV
jgi:large conductance mechanosensitive channel